MQTNTYAKFWIFVILLVIPFGGESKDSPRPFRLDNVKVTYHFMDEDSRRKEAEISSLISRAFSVYTKLFGGLPRDLLGNEYNEIMVHVKKEKHLKGEADPRLVILTWSDVDKTFGFGSWQVLLLHELFHLWNAESFRYQDGQEQWFNEGVSEYYAYRAAVQLGLISKDAALTTVAFPIGYYSAAAGAGSLSMREAGKTNKTKFENYFLVYHGGWLVSMILDYDIRKRTGGEKSLDDLMRWMYQNYKRNQTLYNLNDIVKGLALTTNKDYSRFFDLYIDGTNMIPVSEYFPLSDAIWASKFKTHSSTQYQFLYDSLRADF